MYVRHLKTHTVGNPFSAPMINVMLIMFSAGVERPTDFMDKFGDSNVAKPANAPLKHPVHSYVHCLLIFSRSH